MSELKAVQEEVDGLVAAWMLEHDLGEPPLVAIGFQCEACGQFCMFDFGEVWPKGECHACSRETEITRTSYVLLMAAPGGHVKVQGKGDYPNLDVWSREETDDGEADV